MKTDCACLRNLQLIKCNSRALGGVVPKVWVAITTVAIPLGPVASQPPIPVAPSIPVALGELLVLLPVATPCCLP